MAYSTSRENVDRRAMDHIERGRLRDDYRLRAWVCGCSEGYGDRFVMCEYHEGFMDGLSWAVS